MNPHASLLSCTSTRAEQRRSRVRPRCPVCTAWRHYGCSLIFEVDLVSACERMFQVCRTFCLCVMIAFKCYVCVCVCVCVCVRVCAFVRVRDVHSSCNYVKGSMIGCRGSVWIGTKGVNLTTPLVVLEQSCSLHTTTGSVRLYDFKPHSTNPNL